MDKFFGSAIFEFADGKEDICICLNLLENVIETYFYMDSKEAFKLVFHKTDWMTRGGLS